MGSNVGTLVQCNLRSILRKQSNKNLFFLSSFFLFGLLFTMWYLSAGNNLTFLSDEVISKLSVDMICKSDKQTPYHCQPYMTPEEKSKQSHSITPTTFLFHLMNGKPNDNRYDMKHLAKLLGSIMMNGLPMLGLDDFVHASDFVNRYLGLKTQKEIIQSPFLSGQFGNFLNVRHLQIRLSPKNCWTQAFVKYLRKTSTFIQNNTKNIKIYKSMYHATRSKHCCSSVWVHIEIISKSTGTCPTGIFMEDQLEANAPLVTLRFHPASIPDSRNKMWSPRKHGGGTHTSLQTGQLLYFTSGFLSIQLEIQNFLSTFGLGRPILSKALSSSSLSLAGIPVSSSHEISLAETIAKNIISANSKEDLFQNLHNMTSIFAAPRPVVTVPLYDRAYPTHGYLLDMFWHKLSEMMSIMLIVYFSLPAALIASYFCQQTVNGQFDTLFSLPGVTISTCMNAWIMTCCCVILLPVLFSTIFFLVVLKYTSLLIPIINLSILGITFAPISIIISLIVKKSDTAVVAVPIVIFLGLLPGLLYYDLAYDVQRGPTVEMLLCLLPPSAGLMIIKLLCSFEAYHTPLLWTTTTIVSNVPLYIYTEVLLFDFFLYYLIALFFAWHQFRVKEKYFLGPTYPPQISFNSHPQFDTSNNLFQTKSRSWINFTKLGIPFQFHRHLMERYFPIPDDHFENETSTQLRDQINKRNSISVTVSGLGKSYETLEGSPIEVLKEVNGELLKGSITTLLGSNGAGKTTLLRILGGFDANYSGHIGYHFDSYRNPSRRIVGWCPQSDPLFEYLTVNEHLEMFLTLLEVRNSNHIFETHIPTILSRVNLLDHCEKPIHMLSGGMKRRLSLLLACLGDPCILLLDEPTSGCDSYTRELVRKDIINRKDYCAILISTHHIDDVEIISDQVWFLNEHNLIYNGPLIDLHEERHDEHYSYQSNRQYRESLSSFVEFSTSSLKIKELFQQQFPNQSTTSLIPSKFGLIYSWTIPISSNSPHNKSKLQQLIVNLETQGYSQWSLISPNAYKALSRMYDITEATYQNHSQNENISLNHIQFIPKWFSYFKINLFVQRLYYLIKLRFLEVKSQPSHFVISHLVLPFFIVLFIVFACGDVRYPKLELHSESIGGVGEILLADGAHHSQLSSNINMKTSQILTPEMIFNSSGCGRNESEPEDMNLLRQNDNSFIWKGFMSSESLFTELSNEYFNHTTNRWASFVVDDTIDDWLQSTVRIPKDSVKMPFHDILETLSALHSIVCQNHTTAAPQLDSNVISEVSSRKIQFCTHLSNIEFKLVNDTSSHSTVSQHDLTHAEGVNANSNTTNTNSNSNTENLMITVYQSLHSNLTMMTNITTDHGSPIFLKEIAPSIYNSLPILNTDSYSDSTIINVTNDIRRPSYTLFSHPFDDATDSSSTYIERGYLGALMILLYTLLVSSVSVNFITNNNKSGVKTQVHLCGVPPLTYWIANYLSDCLFLFLSFGCIYLAILFGGAPIRNFFFINDSGLVFLLSLFLFASSSVSSNYAFAVLSKDQITSQLFSLISSISSGLFLKFFLSLQSSHEPFILISNWCIVLSPSYAFSSCVFEMFTSYVKQLGKSIGIIDNDVQLSYNAVYFPMIIMLFQTIFYLSLTILVDQYWYQLFCHFQRLLDSFNYFHLPRNRTGSFSQTVKEKLLQYIEMATSITRRSDDSHEYLEVNHQSESFHSEQSLSVGRGLEKIISTMTPPSSPKPQSQQSPLTSTFRNSNNNPLLSLENLSVKYPFDSKETLKSLDFQINYSERVALMGINGGGKSTFFKTLSTNETIPVSGMALLCGCDTVMNHWKLGEVRAVGYVPQEGGLLEYLTVREALEFFIGLRERSENLNNSIDNEEEGHDDHNAIISQSIFSILPKKYLSYPIQSLSGGNKKKLSVVLSNLNSPSILLLDEPSSGVDPAAAERIVTFLSNLPRNQAIIFASHRLDECLRICHRVLMLYHGRLQFDGNMTQLDNISDLFYQVDVNLFSEQHEHLQDAEEEEKSRKRRVGRGREIGQQQQQQQQQQQYVETNCIVEFVNLLQLSLQTYLNCPDLNLLERVVNYNKALVRITFEKNTVPFSTAWKIFDELSGKGRPIKKYSFRKMDMEEIFAIILSDTRAREEDDK